MRVMRLVDIWGAIIQYVYILQDVFMREPCRSDMCCRGIMSTRADSEEMYGIKLYG